MASVDSPTEYQQAISAGWRTFRTRLASEPLDPQEVVCPASDESGSEGVSCAKCLLCGGDQRSSGKNVAIFAHGSKSRLIAYVENRIK